MHPIAKRRRVEYEGKSRCRSVDHYEKIKTISEGTYGVVYKAKCRDTGEIVALKRLKLDTRVRNKAGFPHYALREIQTLFRIEHQNVLGIKEVVVGKSLAQMFLVMEFMEHEVKSLVAAKSDYFSQSEVKCLLLQLLRGVNALHSRWIVHRDLKTSNLLMNNQGILKIADLGLARKFESPLLEYTKNVITLWYRPPELLLGCEKYSSAVDMWSVGCIFAELLTKKPLFEGAQNEIEQITKIFELVGSPTLENWPTHMELPYMQKFSWKYFPPGKLRERFCRAAHLSLGTFLTQKGYDLLSRLLSIDPSSRITAEEALTHPWFDEPPRPQDPGMISLTLPHYYGDTHRE
jgi:cell division cycle 2-like protein